MSSKFLESDEVDSKIFAGRCLTLLGEILKNQHNLMDYLEYAFHIPPSDSEASVYLKELQGNPRGTDDDEDYGDGSDEE